MVKNVDGQNLEFKKSRIGHNVERKKRRLGQKVEEKKRRWKKNVEKEKICLEITPNVKANYVGQNIEK